MSLAEKIAVKIGNNARQFLNSDEESEEIIIYGAINLFQTIFAILWVMIAGLFFGVFYEALLFSVTASILRKYSGGVHASSSSRCIAIGAISSSIVGIFIDNIFYSMNIYKVLSISLAFIIFAFIIITKNAPVDSIQKPITNNEIKKEFKMKSIIVLFIFLFMIIILFICSRKYMNLHYIEFIESISLGVLWQTITLTKIGISLLNKVDFVLRYII